MPFEEIESTPGRMPGLPVLVRRLSRHFRLTLFAYMVVLVGVITLAPFDFEVPEQWVVRWRSSLLNLITNVILFMPIGFLYRLATRERPQPFLIRSLLVALLISSGIETLQLFSEGRITSGADLLANGLGGWLGAAGFSGLWNFLEEGNTRGQVPFLELPLINLLYLIVPLLWLSGLATEGESSRLILLLLLSAYGLGVLLSIYLHRLRGLTGFSALRMTSLAASWLIIAALPAAAVAPGPAILMMAVLSGLFWILARSLTRLSRERRFEIPTLRALLPLYLAYLILLVGWPSLIPMSEWSALIGDFPERIALTFRFVEVLVAFTLLGYMVSEMMGRSATSPQRRPVAALAAAALTLTAGLGIRWVGELLIPGPLELIILLGGALSGAMIYSQQLASLRKGPGQ